MSDLGQVFRTGLPLPEHRARVRVHKAAFEQVHAGLASVADLERGRAPLRDRRVLVLTEDYCVDAVLNLGLLGRLAEASPAADVRVVSRDAHRALAARFPGRGGESRLPTAVFLDGVGGPVGYWAERSQADHAWMRAFVARDPMPDLTIRDGQPTPRLRAWMDRRLARQMPIFLSGGWRHAAEELAAVALGAGDRAGHAP